MIPVQQPYRPSLVPRQATNLKGSKLGAVGDLTLGDWALLIGGTVVGGAGVNGVVKQFTGKKKRKPDFIAVGLGLVFAAVGLSVMVGEGRKALA